MSNFLKKITNFENLTPFESAALMRQIMSPQMSEGLKAAVLVALKMKGETVEELVGMARVMREAANKVPVKNPLLDTCGTGGSGLPRLNVSTAAAFILAACGVRVAKHGNRAAATSKCGGFDVIEGLGGKIELGPNQVARTIKETGLGFMFAPLYHSAIKHVMPVRRELGIKTVFNILGPLTNPAGAKYQVLGVSCPQLGPKMIEVLRRLGAKRALVVCGEDGLDEVTLTGPTKVWELTTGGTSKKYIIKPEDFGYKRVAFSQIRGGEPKYNVKIIQNILTGQLRDARRDLILFNAAAGLYIADKTTSIKQGLSLAQKTLESGQVKIKLEEYIKLTLEV